MTSIFEGIITCPECGNEDRHYGTASFNTFGWRRWSDGWSGGSSGSNSFRPLHCERCDAIFPKIMGEFRQAEGADDVTGPRFLGKPRPDAPAASSGESLFERMARLGSSYSEPDTTAPSTSGHALARGPRARSKSGSPIRELSPCYPLDLCFDWSAREALEAGRLIGEETEFRLRLQCWWDWNSQYRKEVGNEPAQMAAPSKDRNEIPEDLLANLAQLLPMLQAKGLDAIAGDILRRQGRFSEAITRFKADKQLRPEWCEKLIALARKGRPELVEI